MSVTIADTSAEQGQAAREQAGDDSRRRSRAGSWLIPVTALSIVLGGVFALALRTQAQIRNSGLASGPSSMVTRFLSSYRTDNQNLQEEIKSLRQKQTEYENAMANRDKATAALNGTLQNVKMLAGLSRVKGPGVIVTLNDSPLQMPGVDVQKLIVHDTDINRILDELKAAGAEALAVGGADPDPEKLQRITSRTTVRCVGPSAIVNDARLAAPYRIYAVGNPKELQSQLMMPGGVVKATGMDILQMVSIKEVQQMELPEHSGRVEFTYARPAEPPRGQ